MKIQCDVCSSAEASVFCCADEAALCCACDRRVHRANKLAGKHRRFSLHHPSSRPICDICKERRGFVFCQQDRAILCRECDAPIHNATSLTMKHSRFLLTGVGLSPTPVPASEEESTAFCNTTTTTTVTDDSTTTTTTSSSISEYLIKMLPGWHVEDFLTDDSGATTGDIGDDFFQVEDTVPFLEQAESFPCMAAPAAGGCQMLQGGYKEGGGVKAASRRRRSEDAFAVPQIRSGGGGGAGKRSKPILWSF